MNNLSVRAKLSFLVGLMVLEMPVVAGAGLFGVSAESTSVGEIGENRLSSVHDLMLANEGQTAVKAARKS